MTTYSLEVARRLPGRPIVPPPTQAARGFQQMISPASTAAFSGGYAGGYAGWDGWSGCSDAIGYLPGGIVQPSTNTEYFGRRGPPPAPGWGDLGGAGRVDRKCRVWAHRTRKRRAAYKVRPTKANYRQWQRAKSYRKKWCTQRRAVDPDAQYKEGVEEGEALYASDSAALDEVLAAEGGGMSDGGGGGSMLVPLLVVGALGIGGILFLSSRNNQPAQGRR